MIGQHEGLLGVAVSERSNNRSKFRSQNSDKMDRWKAEVGRGKKRREEKKKRREEKRRGEERRGEERRGEERREEKRREEERRSTKRRSQKKIHVCEKVGKSPSTVFFQWFVAPEGRKVGSLKRRVRSHLARWDEKLRAVVVRSTLQVKKLKTSHVRNTFGSWDVEKVHAVVARSTCPSQNVQSKPCSDHFWKLRCRKSARCCGVKHMSKSKCTKHTMLGPLLEVDMSKKCKPLWREAHVEVKRAKNWGVRTTFGRSDVVFRGRYKGLCTLSKKSKTWGFSSMSKNNCRRGTFEEDLERCIFRGRRSARDMFIRDVRRPLGLISWEGLHFGHQIFSFGKMILRDRCSTLYKLASLFRGRRKILQSYGLERSQNALVRDRQLCIQLSIIEGSLAELLRFWCCQFQKLRRPRRIALFSILQKDR